MKEREKRLWKHFDGMRFWKELHEYVFREDFCENLLFCAKVVEIM